MIQRPKKVQRAEKGYLTNEKYQDYAEKQFKTIYDYLDGLVGKQAFIGETNGSINLPSDYASYDYMEVEYYCYRDNRKIGGTKIIPITDETEFSLSEIIYKSATYGMLGSLAQYKIENGVLTLKGYRNFEITDNTMPYVNSADNVFVITKIKLRKE